MTPPGEGETRLRQATRRMARALRPKRHEAISIAPSSPCEAILIERLEDLQRQVDALTTRVNVLILLIVSTAVTLIFKSLTPTL